MQELKLNETGMLHGKLVKCVSQKESLKVCNDCAFITSASGCNNTICFGHDHSSGEEVIYIPVEK